MALGLLNLTCQRECALKIETHLGYEPHAAAPAAMPQWISVPQLVAQQAGAHPEAVAVVSSSQRLTYAELDRSANQLAHYLRATGVGEEHVVGLHLERSPASVISALAVLKAGAAYLPLDPSLPAERLRYMLADANVSVVMSRAQTPRCCPSTRGRCWIGALASFARRLPVGLPRSAVPAASLAYVIYTSGSTASRRGLRPRMVGCAT